MAVTPKVPFGSLVSFAGTTFSGGGAVGTGSNTPINVNVEWTSALASLPGQQYPYDLYGLSAAPRKPVEATWKYLIVAGQGLTDAQQWQAIQDAWSQIYNNLVGTYTYSGNAGTSGQVGDLVVSDAYGTNYTARARLVKMSCDMQPGTHNAAYEISLTWAILSDWA